MPLTARSYYSASGEDIADNPLRFREGDISLERRLILWMYYFLQKGMPVTTIL